MVKGPTKSGSRNRVLTRHAPLCGPRSSQIGQKGCRLHTSVSEGRQAGCGTVCRSRAPRPGSLLCLGAGAGREQAVTVDSGRGDAGVRGGDNDDEDRNSTDENASISGPTLPASTVPTPLHKNHTRKLLSLPSPPLCTRKNKGLQITDLI